MTTAQIRRLIRQPQKYTNLSDSKQAGRLVNDIQQIVIQANRNFEILTIPMPENLAGAESNGAAVISWEDVDNDYRFSLDGAKIWKADASVDAKTDFYQNNARIVLVNCIRTTKYTDVAVTTGDWIYWVQWINKDGVASLVAGGLTVTIA